LDAEEQIADHILVVFQTPTLLKGPMFWGLDDENINWFLNQRMPRSLSWLKG